jgi:uncharacterized protein (TIGR02594 family)
MSNIPAAYKWVANVPNLPKMVALGLTIIGIKEYPGTGKNNPLIMGMAKDLNLASSIYPNDETAWCALAQSWLCLRTGKPLPGSGKGYDLVRAHTFLTWGNSVPVPMFGDILVFGRKNGDHVGMYIAEDLTHYHIMGGNESNSYWIMRLEKDRLELEGARRYYSIAPPASVRQYIVAPTGEISLNEA